MISKKWLSVAGAGVLALGLVACASDGAGNGPGGNGTELTGQIDMDGSSTVGPLSEVAADLFMRANRGVTITVAISGTSGGFAKFCVAETQVNNASRPIRDDEVELCGENGVGFDQVQVANDALSLVVNQANPVDCLTVEQARQIWDLDTTVSTWDGVAGLDVPAELGGQRINLYGPGTDSGTFDFFTEAINGEIGRITLDYTDIGEDDFAAVRGVSGDVAAMGYIPYSYYQENQDQVKALQIDDGNGCVDAALENVLDGSYTPLGRPLFVYVSDVALQEEAMLAFMEFYIEENDEIAERAGFIPLNDQQRADSLAKVAALAGS